MQIQWVSGYYGIVGYVQADELAAAAHGIPPSNEPLMLEDVRAVMFDHLRMQHLDSRIARGERIDVITSCHSLTRQQRTTILCARVGCMRRGDQWVRHGLDTSDTCRGCGSVKTLEHLFLTSPMLAAYKAQRLILDSLTAFLWLRGSSCTRERTTLSLCVFLEQTGIMSCLLLAM